MIVIQKVVDECNGSPERTKGAQMTSDWTVISLIKSAYPYFYYSDQRVKPSLIGQLRTETNFIS